MDILAQLTREHSRSSTIQIVNWIGSDQKRFDQLIDIFLHGEYRITQRAAWPLSYCAIEYPHLIKTHYTKLLKQLEQPNKHPAIKRNILRLLDQGPLPPKSIHGKLMSLCFDFSDNPQAPIAIRAFSLGILYRMTSFYPEITAELLIIIENHFENATAGFKSRARKIRNALSK